MMLKGQRMATFAVFLGLVVCFLGCASTQSHEIAGQYLDDSVITTKVKAGLFDELSLKTVQINVTTHKGVVQLSGFVDSAQNVDKAGKIAAGVPGVKEVRNDLILRI